MTNLVEERDHRTCAQLLASVGQGASGYIGVGPEQAQTARQLAEDPADRDGGKQMQGDDQPDGQSRRHPTLTDAYSHRYHFVPKVYVARGCAA